MTSYAPIFPKIKLSGATNQGMIKESRNRIAMRESWTDE